MIKVYAGNVEELALSNQKSKGMRLTEMKNLCMFCMKEHGTEKPLECQIKSIAASALFSNLQSHEAMLICDRTAYLEMITEKMKQLIVSEGIKKLIDSGKEPE